MLMENRVDDICGSEIPKKPRSLDLKSLYESKASQSSSPNRLKKRNGVDHDPGNKKKKRRKEVSISSLENSNGNSSKSSEEVYKAGLSAKSHDSKSSKVELDQNLNDVRGFSGIPLSVVKIPKRKRDFKGRRKVENGSELSKGIVQCGVKLRDIDEVGRLGEASGVVDDVKPNSRTGFDDLADSRNEKSETDGTVEGNCGKHYHSVEKNGESSSDGCHDGHLVQNNGESSSIKPVKKRKRSRKKNDLIPDSRNVAREVEQAIDTSSEAGADLQKEDEENLEENAARMLSSRFNPSCTGFPVNGKASALPLTNDLSFQSSSGHEFAAYSSDNVTGVESESVDGVDKVLYPSKDHKENDSTRKRRHYYEIFSGDLDAYWVLNRRIKVYWPLDQSWYLGLVSEYDKERKRHHIKYDDRDEEWIDLQTERFKLLLLPSEAPIKSQRYLREKKRTDKLKAKLNSTKEKKRDLTTEDESHVGNYTDSEPIISWLARATHRVKSSALSATKKQKTAGKSSELVSPMLSEEAYNKRDCDGGSISKGKSKLSDNCASPGNLASSGSRTTSATESVSCSKDNKFIVYYRKRFRNRSNVFHLTSNECHPSIKENVRDTSVVPGAVSFLALKENEIASQSLAADRAVELLNSVEALWSVDTSGLLKVNTMLMKSRQFRFGLTNPLPRCNSLVTKNTWFIHVGLLSHYWRLTTTWPRVNLEIFFVDNIVGLRLLLFEGHLKQVLAFVFLVLRVFEQPPEQGNDADKQFPVTSIRFKLSCLTGSKKQLMFAFYKFSIVGNTKWMYLDHKLRRHCLLSRQLPLSECTYNGIKALQNGNTWLSSPSSSRDSIALKDQQMRSRQFSLMGVSRKFDRLNASQFTTTADKNHRYLPPFFLSFSAAPTFFLGLHLKLLMEHTLARISFPDHDLVDDRENSEIQLAEDSSVIECSKSPEINIVQNFEFRLDDVDCDGCLCSSSKPQTVSVSTCSNGDQVKLSSENQNLHESVETFVNLEGPTKLGTSAVTPSQKLQCHHSEEEQLDLLPKVTTNGDKSNTGFESHMNGLRVDIPPHNQFEERVGEEQCGSQQALDLSSNNNDSLILEPNQTTQRSNWHQNSTRSAAMGYISHGRSSGRTDFLQNSFHNGPKKPRTQVSYALPFGSYDYSKNNRCHQPKGLLHKRIRTPNEKRSSDSSRSSERNMELLSCDANILITVGDRGWRECGAQVCLELFEHNEWRLAVKLSGITKYLYKAHQFLQPGTVNRHTHAMMWKGGKDWILEFTDRSQWACFKEMHEECYNRNIRAALIKNIPIPGVHVIEEPDDNSNEIPFFRSSSYFQQVETDAEIALNPSRVLYDMDSDDEEWLLKIRSSSENSRCLWDFSEDIFEKTMDMFEKAAYEEKPDQFTSLEAEELMAGVLPVEAIKIIYDYWLQKRQRKGMPLIRHLQPPLWEKYQEQVREWELATMKGKSGFSGGFQDKVAHAEKPPMFAFCLKPRGLEVPNKGSKQRSQKKILVAGQSSNIAGYHDVYQFHGRRSNGVASGDERFLYSGRYYDSLEDSPLSQISPRTLSPQDEGGTGYFKMRDGFDRNSFQRLQRSKSKNHAIYVSSNETPTFASHGRRIFEKRRGFHQWNTRSSDWSSQNNYQIDGSFGQGIEHLDSSVVDELRWRDASAGAKHARTMAKLKREKAQRLLYRADLAMHKAAAALMTADVIKASVEDNGGGWRKAK